MNNYGDKNPSEKEKWICIYPAYINSKKTVADGRRIPKNKAVENPTSIEMIDALASSGLNAYSENKLYCRERSKEALYRGRIRVQLKKEDGTLFNEQFPSRESIMLYISCNIPKLKSRTVKQSSDHHPRSETSKKKGKGGRR